MAKMLKDGAERNVDAEQGSVINYSRAVYIVMVLLVPKIEAEMEI
jgi:hypothetical protein